VKIGRNEPCWCGSGKKFKVCHLRREREPPISHQEIIERQRTLLKGSDCLHPDAPKNCSGAVIQSHSISRSGGLNEIAEDGHVMTFYADYGVFLRTDGDIEPRRLSIRKASVFPAFCAFHDSSTFEPVEKYPYSPCGKHAFLTSYRALCREIFFARKDPSLADFDRGMSIAGQIGVQLLTAAKQKEDSLKLKSLSLLKADYDSALLHDDFSEMSFYSVKLEKPPDVMVSSMFAPFASFQGERIRYRDVLGTKDDHLIVSLFASSSVGWFQLAWLGVSEAGLSFARSFNILSDDQMPHAIMRLVFSHFENRFFRPSWWAALPESDQAALRRRFWNPADPFVPEPISYLQDDGRRSVNWRVIARIFNIKF
jgi:SEC-C motif-containing protein